MTGFPALKTFGLLADGAMHITPLGGLDGIGRNMTAFGLNGKLLIVNCGMLFPEEDQPGINLILPDSSPTEHRINDVVVLALTHRHKDHTGGVSYLLRLRDGIPLVGSGLTLAFVEVKLKEHRIRPVLRQVIEHEEVSYGPFDLEFVAVNHSIPDTMAIMIRTDAGNMLATGDFRIDSLPVDGRITDLRFFTRFDEEGVDLFCVDSTDAEVLGMVDRKGEIGQVPSSVFVDSDGQVVVASFVNHIRRVQQALDVAALYSRRVALARRSIVRNMGVAAECGYLKVPAGVLIGARDITSLLPYERVLMVTGSQEEPMAAPSRTVHSERHSVIIEPGDTIILASFFIPGNENSAFRVISQFMRLGVHVVHQDNAKVHVSGRVSSKELLHTYNIVQPRSVIPIHGGTHHLVASGGLAVKMRIAPKRVMLCEGGVAVDLRGEMARIVGQVPCNYICVSGSLVGEIDEAKLKDQCILAEKGFVSIYTVVEATTGAILAGPHIQARGVAEDDSVLEEILPDVAEVLSVALEIGKAGAYSLRQVMYRTPGRWIGRRLRYRPMIVPVVIEAQEEGAHCITFFRSMRSIPTGFILIDIPLHVSSIPTSGGAITGALSGPAVGGGYTVVSAATRQGVLIALIATLGTGPSPARVRESMRLDRVGLLVEKPVGDIGTYTTPIESSGRRTLIITAGVEGKPQHGDLESIDLKAGDWAYVADYDLAHYASRDILTGRSLPIPDGVGLVIDLGSVQSDIPDQVPLSLLRKATILTGNDLEMGRPGKQLDGTGAIRRACLGVLITRHTGVSGCVLHPVGDKSIEVPGSVREVVDTTGAGDTRAGVLVAGLLGGPDIVEVARRVNAAAAHAVVRSGPAQAPLCREVDEFLRADDERP